MKFLTESKDQGMVNFAKDRFFFLLKFSRSTNAVLGDESDLTEVTSLWRLFLLSGLNSPAEEALLICVANQSAINEGHFASPSIWFDVE